MVDSITKKIKPLPFNNIYEGWEYEVGNFFIVFKDYIKALDTQDRKIIKEWKDNFFMEHHRTKYKNYYFTDGEIAYYLYQPLLGEQKLFQDLWFKQGTTTEKPDFKCFSTKKSFINYYMNYTWVDFVCDYKSD